MKTGDRIGQEGVVMKLSGAGTVSQSLSMGHGGGGGAS